jgi:hypothetical protein
MIELVAQPSHRDRLSSKNVASTLIPDFGNIRLSFSYESSDGGDLRRPYRPRELLLMDICDGRSLEQAAADRVCSLHAADVYWA